jgi:hypothetical protein
MACRCTGVERRRSARPKLSPPSLADVVGGLVLLAIAALLVAIAVLTAAG